MKRRFVFAMDSFKGSVDSMAAGRAAADGPSVYVGPEGDFTPDELKALLAFATPTTFGPTILRAETAAIFAVLVLSSRLA